MSLEQFITKLLNLKESYLQDLLTTNYVTVTNREILLCYLHFSPRPIIKEEAGNGNYTDIACKAWKETAHFMGGYNKTGLPVHMM